MLPCTLTDWLVMDAPTLQVMFLLERGGGGATACRLCGALGGDDYTGQHEEETRRQSFGECEENQPHLLADETSSEHFVRVTPDSTTKER